jgi:hypothetical protein
MSSFRVSRGVIYMRVHRPKLVEQLVMYTKCKNVRFTFFTFLSCSFYSTRVQGSSKSGELIDRNRPLFVFDVCVSAILGNASTLAGCIINVNFVSSFRSKSFWAYATRWAARVRIGTILDKWKKITHTAR